MHEDQPLRGTTFYGSMGVAGDAFAGAYSLCCGRADRSLFASACADAGHALALKSGFGPVAELIDGAKRSAPDSDRSSSVDS
jgi:hypothetical protein